MPPTWLENLMSMLQEGKIADVLYTLYTSVFGREIFITIIVITLAASVYLRSWTIGVAAFLFISGYFISYLVVPGMHTIGWILLVIGLIILFYSLVKTRL